MYDGYLLLCVLPAPQGPAYMAQQYITAWNIWSRDAAPVAPLLDFASCMHARVLA